MSSTSTIYDVKVRYAMEGNASKGIKNLAGDTDKAAKSAMSLKGALAAVGGVALLKGAKSAFIDFNSEIDQMKIGLVAVMQMQLKMPFEKARMEADKLFNVFQQMAKKSPATTKDFMEMGNAIAPVVAMMGGGTDKIAKLAQGGVLASTAFGERADVVALDIKQMLSGTVSSKDRIAQQLIASKGMDSEKFNALDGKKRASMTESMLQDPALMKAADSMGASFAGQTSTLKDNLQMALGEVGKPLMEQLTAEVKKWNDWIERHPAKIARIGNQLSGMLTQTVTFVKDVGTFLVDNSDLLMTIGKIFLVFKGTQMATGAVSGFAKGISSFVDSLKTGATKMGGAVGEEGGSGILGSIGKVGKGLFGMLPALGAVTTALFAVGGWIRDNLLNSGVKKLDPKQGSAVEGMTETMNEVTGITKQLKKFGGDPSKLSTKDQAKKAELLEKLNDPVFAGAVLRNMGVDQLFAGEDGKEMFKKHGLNAFLKAKGKDEKTLGDYAASTQMSKQDKLRVLNEGFGLNAFEGRSLTKDQLELVEQMYDTMITWQENMDMFTRGEMYDAATGTYKSPVEKGWSGGAGAGDVNVTIQRVEVASEDPDRFVFGLVQMADKAVKHATQSQHTTPGGF